MEYSVNNYFEADTNLKAAIPEIDRLHHSTQKAPLHQAKERMKIAADKVDELIEIFTWETKNTDNIFFPANKVPNYNQIIHKSIPLNSIKFKNYFVSVKLNRK